MMDALGDMLMVYLVGVPVACFCFPVYWWTVLSKGPLGRRIVISLILCVILLPALFFPLLILLAFILSPHLYLALVLALVGTSGVVALPWLIRNAEKPNEGRL